MTDHPEYGILPRFIPLIGTIGGDAARKEAPAAPLLKLGPGGDFTQDVGACHLCGELGELNGGSACPECAAELNDNSEAPYGRCTRDDQCGRPLTIYGYCQVHSTLAERRSAVAEYEADIHE